MVSKNQHLFCLSDDMTVSGVLPFHFQKIVLGDLPKSEAFKFFEDRVEQLPAQFRKLFNTDLATFDEIFKITGGRMLLIEQYLIEAGQMKEEVFRSSLSGNGDAR